MIISRLPRVGLAAVAPGSAAATHLHQGSPCCPFRDVLLHIYPHTLRVAIAHKANPLNTFWNRVNIYWTLHFHTQVAFSNVFHVTFEDVYGQYIPTVVAFSYPRMVQSWENLAPSPC